jgi:5-methylcytosine-specific restriction protein A
LFLRGPENLTISVEYLVLQSPWRTLFSDEQLAVARQRLIDVGCPLPADDNDNVDVGNANPTTLPEEVCNADALYEGAVTSILVNVYERNPIARQQCIEHYGTSCLICGFDFAKAYGTLAEGYIHVHHEKPLSTIGASYIVDPVEDLKPVCPNCHAVIHMHGECRSLAEVKMLFAKQLQPLGT